MRQQNAEIRRNPFRIPRNMRYTGKTREHIRSLFLDRTGIAPEELSGQGEARDQKAPEGAAGIAASSPLRASGKRFALAAGGASLICALAAFGFAKFSTLRGDTLRLAASYEGNGVVRLELRNDSERELAITQIRLMQWATAEEVPGDDARLLWESEPIGAGSEAVRYVDLSQAYDVAALEEGLPDGDHFYLELTNNGFAEGQNWMVAVDFSEERRTDAVVYTAPREKPELAEQEKQMEDEEELLLRNPGWAFPAERRILSASYGERENGTFSDHVSFKGELGDAVYAVADGTVIEAGFDASRGNYILLRLADEPRTVVAYGHLDEAAVLEGEDVKAGEILGTLGQSGLATGPNLFFAVYEDGEAVNPIGE